jgi:uncharacterized protein YkwD
LLVLLISALLVGLPSAALESAAAAKPGARLSLIAPPNRCQDESSPARRARAIQGMVCLTNYARRAKGLRPYRRSRRLDRSASMKSADILRCNSFSHTACGRPFGFWIEKGYVTRQCWWAGENIAWGSYGLGSTREIFKAWMRSPGHRAAILSRNYKDIGIGFRMGKLGRWKSARVWVQHFGRLC